MNIVPNSFDQEKENQEYNYTFMSTYRNERVDPRQPWTQGDAPDGKGEFSYEPRQPGGGNPDLDEMYNEVQ